MIAWTRHDEKGLVFHSKQWSSSYNCGSTSPISHLPTCGSISSDHARNGWPWLFGPNPPNRLVLSIHYERYSVPVFVVSKVPISTVGSGKSCTSNLLDRWWSLLTLSAGLMEHDGTWWNQGWALQKRLMVHRSFHLHSLGIPTWNQEQLQRDIFVAQVSESEDVFW